MTFLIVMRIGRANPLTKNSAALGQTQPKEFAAAGRGDGYIHGVVVG
jgi:hypothetical protein